MISDVTSHLFLYLNYFEQYKDAIYDSPLFSPTEVVNNGDMSDSPTQTSAPEPANRAERRASVKK